MRNLAPLWLGNTIHTAYIYFPIYEGSEIQITVLRVRFTEIVVSGAKVFIGPFYVTAPIRFWMTIITSISLTALMATFICFDLVFCLPVSLMCLADGSSDSAELESDGSSTSPSTASACVVRLHWQRSVHPQVCDRWRVVVHTASCGVTCHGRGPGVRVSRRSADALSPLQSSVIRLLLGHMEPKTRLNTHFSILSIVFENWSFCLDQWHYLNEVCSCIMLALFFICANHSLHKFKFVWTRSWKKNALSNLEPISCVSKLSTETDFIVHNYL